MGKLYNFLLGLAIGFGLYHALSNYHLVNAADGLQLVEKQTPRLSEIYVDVRNFKPADWADHPQLVLDLQKAGKEQILKDAAIGAVNDAVGRELDKILPPAQPAEN